MSVFRIHYLDKAGKKRSTKRWHIEFRDHLGRRQRVPGFADKASSREFERKLERLVALRSSGATPDDAMRRWIEGIAPALRDRLAAMDLLTARQVAALRPLTELLDAWEEHLLAKGTSRRQITQVLGRARRLFEGAGIAVWNEIDAGRVEQYLRGARARKKRPLSARTSNFYLQAARQFCRWAVRVGIATEEPLRILTPLNPESDRRKERRALTAEELARLLAKTETGPRLHGIPGPERALIYRVAVETGLRRNEIQTLLVGDLDVAAPERASVRVRAKNAKNGRDARLPLRDATARALRAHVAKRLPTAQVFEIRTHWRSWEMLAEDLAAAKIPVKDDAGRVLDFHALRTTFGTNLARGGVALQLAQRLMRHSDPKLTSSVYSVLSREDEREAIAVLPTILEPSPRVVDRTGSAGR